MGAYLAVTLRNSMTATATQTTPTTPRAAVARTADACAYLRLSRTTLHRLVKAGKLKPVQLGVRAVGFRYDDLDAFLSDAAK